MKLSFLPIGLMAFTLVACNNTTSRDLNAWAKKNNIPHFVANFSDDDGCARRQVSKFLEDFNNLTPEEKKEALDLLRSMDVELVASEKGEDFSQIDIYEKVSMKSPKSISTPLEGIDTTLVYRDSKKEFRGEINSTQIDVRDGVFKIKPIMGMADIYQTVTSSFTGWINGVHVSKLSIETKVKIQTGRRMECYYLISLNDLVKAHK